MALLTLHQQMQCLQYLVGFGGTELQRQLQNFSVQAVQEFTQLRDRLATANVSSSEKFNHFSEWAHRAESFLGHLVNNTLPQLQQSLPNIKTAIEALYTHLDKTSGLLHVTHSDLQKLSTHTNQKHESFAYGMDCVQKRMGDLEDELQLLKDALATLNTSLETLNTEHTSLHTSWSADRKNITKIYEGQKQQQKNVESLHSQHQSLLEQFANLRQLVHSLPQNPGSQHSQSTLQLQKSYSTLEKAVQELQNTVVALPQPDSASLHHPELQRRLDLLEAKIDSLATSSSSTAQLQNLQAQLKQQLQLEAQAILSQFRMDCQEVCKHQRIPHSRPPPISIPSTLQPTTLPFTTSLPHNPLPPLELSPPPRRPHSTPSPPPQQPTIPSPHNTHPPHHDHSHIATLQEQVTLLQQQVAELRVSPTHHTPSTNPSPVYKGFRPTTHHGISQAYFIH